MMKYSRFKTPTTNIYLYKFSAGEADKSTSQKSISNLNKLIRDESIPLYCRSCGRSYIKYEGLGQYRCLDCESIMYDNYGKVRQCLDINGSMSEIQLMDQTGLTKRDIRKLIEAGSLIRTTHGLSIV